MVTHSEGLLHTRILRHCFALYQDGHYKNAALEAMTQVELALKEKIQNAGISEKRYGVFLVKNLFGKDRPSIKLRVPFGDELQSAAEALFTGAFKYYRNYCAHDGSKVDQTTSFRIMILASELLDLIGATSVSFADVGGIDGIVKAGAFRDKKTLVDLLNLLDGYTMPDEEPDGFYDQFYGQGYSDSQLDAVLELELVQYHVAEYVPPAELADDPWLPETLGWYELTDLGRKALVEGEKSL